MMSSHKIKKAIIAVLILGQLGLPLLAMAQVGLPIGFLVDAPIIAALKPIEIANAACTTNDSAFGVADTASQFGLSGLNLISGGGALVAQLTAKIGKLDGAILCHQVQLNLATAVVTIDTFTATYKLTITNAASTAIAGLKSKKEAAQAQLTLAQQGFWKTLIFNVLIKTSKAVANALVAKLVNTYKIRNLKGYADSLATLMYDNQFIRENFPNAQGQFMARAVLENPLFRYQIPAPIFLAADAALGFNPSNLSPSDPSFYAKMAQVGSAPANPYLQHSLLVGGVDQAHSNAFLYAQNQIAQSNGFKAPVTCAGSLNQQKNIDAMNSAAIARMSDRNNLLNNLTQGHASPADIKKAQADYDASVAIWNSLPDSVGTNNPATVMCEAIVSPATLIDKGLNQAFQAVGINMAQYNNNNLPSFINIIGDVASQIGTSLIFGGAAGAKGASLINEGRVVSAISGLAADAAYGQISAALAKGVQFDAPIANTGVPNSYTITWQIISATLPNASYVTLSGDGVSSFIIDPKTQKPVANKLGLNASQAIITTKGGDYLLTVYDASNHAITSATISLDLTSLNPNASTSVPPSGFTPTTGPNPPNPNSVCGGNFASYNDCLNSVGDPSYCASVCGQVHGASTSRPSLNIRGPAMSIQPRG